MAPSCPKCGGQLAAWAEQFEAADEIDVIERTFSIVRHGTVTLPRELPSE